MYAACEINWTLLTAKERMSCFFSWHKSDTGIKSVNEKVLSDNICLAFEYIDSFSETLSSTCARVASEFNKKILYLLFASHLGHSCSQHKWTYAVLALKPQFYVFRFLTEIA
jgi:hypothetical protein